MRAVVVLSLLVFAVASAASADSGTPVRRKTYTSANQEYSLTVDPRWSDGFRKTNPQLTLKSRSGQVLWVRGPDDFESFRFPMHVCVSDDDEHLVFGGYAVHNTQNYEEGLRFYDGSGHLLRYISRRDLPRGQYGISTASWYDPERTRIEGDRLLFFTPGISQPMLFDIHTGETLAGEVIEGQGDDGDWLRRLVGLPEESDPQP